MATVIITLPNDGDVALVEPYNAALNAILAQVNGNLDDNNIASMNGSKIVAGSLPATAFSPSANQGWKSLSAPPNTVVCNGNRSYTLTFNTLDLTAILSPGARVKLARTVAAPTQCTSLNGSTQFYSRASASVAGMTFTDDFVVSGWVKLPSYPTGNADIASRYNGTSGWQLYMLSSGQFSLWAANAGSSNNSAVTSVQSVPLNKWVHVAAQLDMSSFTVTPTTSYTMIDGVDVPATVSRSGTNPTALIQAGNLEIGSSNGGSQLFPGKLAQVAIYSAKVTEANILATISQGLAGTETNLISAYSFNNSINDLNANANNLTANGLAVATTADTPFGQTYSLTGYTNGTQCYGIVTAISFSTNTTMTIQVPEGETIPTSGGVGSGSYSFLKAPYAFPGGANKWRLASLHKTVDGTTSNATFGAFQAGGWALNVPIGEWVTGWQADQFNTAVTTVTFGMSSTALTGLTNAQASNLTNLLARVVPPSAAAITSKAYVTQDQSLAAAVTYVMYSLGATTAGGMDGTFAPGEMFAEFALL